MHTLDMRRRKFIYFADSVDLIIIAHLRSFKKSVDHMQYVNLSKSIILSVRHCISRNGKIDINIFLSELHVSIDSDSLLMTDDINLFLKIKKRFHQKKIYSMKIMQQNGITTFVIVNGWWKITWVKLESSMICFFWNHNVNSLHLVILPLYLIESIPNYMTFQSVHTLYLTTQICFSRWGIWKWRVQMSLMTVAWFWAQVAMAHHGICGWSLNSSTPPNREEPSPRDSLARYHTSSRIGWLKTLTSKLKF